MINTGRSCLSRSLRRTSNHNQSPDSIPFARLSFLYPRWFNSLPDTAVGSTSHPTPDNSGQDTSPRLTDAGLPPSVNNDDSPRTPRHAKSITSQHTTKGGLHRGRLRSQSTNRQPRSQSKTTSVRHVAPKGSEDALATNEDDQSTESRSNNRVLPDSQPRSQLWSHQSRSQLETTSIHQVPDKRLPVRRMPVGRMALRRVTVLNVGGEPLPAPEGESKRTAESDIPDGQAQYNQPTSGQVRRVPVRTGRAPLSFTQQSSVNQSVQNVLSGATAIDKNSKKWQFDPNRTNWLPLAQLLSYIGPNDKFHEKGRKLHLRQRVVEEYSGHTEADMWVHREGANCDVFVLPIEDSVEPGLRTVVLHGTTRSKDLAEKYFRNLEEQIQNHPHAEIWMARSTELTPDILLSHTLPFYAVVSAAKSQNAAIANTLPTLHSVRSFHEAIKLLVNRKVRRLVQREYSGLSHNAFIAKNLIKFFSDPAAVPYASLSALNMALKFVCTHSELSTEQDYLCARSRKLGLRLDAESYNYLLAAALHTQNEEKVKIILNEMREWQVFPDGKAWALLFAAVRNTDERFYLLKVMKNAGVKIESETMNYIGIILVDDRFKTIENSKTQLQEWIGMMDESLGSGWLTSPVFNQLLHQISLKEHWHLATPALQLSIDRGISSDGYRLVYLMSMLRKQGKLQECIDILQQALLNNHNKNERFIVPQAFRIAWDRHCYNLCRVIWRYATTHAIATYHMQAAVTTSLLRNTETTTSNNSLWTIRAGKVVLGYEIDQRELAEAFAELKDESKSDDPMIMLSRYASSPEPRLQQIVLAFKVLKQDLTSWKYYLPMTPDETKRLLQEALKLDMDWHKSGKLDKSKYPSAKALIADSIEVPLTKRTSPSDEEPPPFWFEQMAPWDSDSSTRPPSWKMNKPQAMLNRATEILELKAQGIEHEQQRGDLKITHVAGPTTAKAKPYTETGKNVAFRVYTYK